MPAARLTMLTLPSPEPIIRCASLPSTVNGTVIMPSPCCELNITLPLLTVISTEPFLRRVLPLRFTVRLFWRFTDFVSVTSSSKVTTAPLYFWSFNAVNSVSPFEKSSVISPFTAFATACVPHCLQDSVAASKECEEYTVT